MEQKRLESVFLGTDRELLPLMLAFYQPAATVIRDVTANRRKMWKGADTSKVLFYDIDPAMSPDVVCGWHELPDQDRTVDVLVYDPPHLPVAAASAKSMDQMKNDYGLARSVKGPNIAAMHPSFLSEAKRVLKPTGVIFAKIKDYIHQQRYQWNLEAFNQAVRQAGMTPCDLIIKRDPCGGNLRSGKWKRLIHARNVHCYWVVVRPGKKCGC